MIDLRPVNMIPNFTVLCKMKVNCSIVGLTILLCVNLPWCSLEETKLIVRHFLQWLSDRRKRAVQKNDIGDFLILCFFVQSKCCVLTYL